MRTCLSLGSNLGNKELNLNTAIENLQSQVGEIVEVSQVYETEPWGFETENNFLNSVAIVETDLEPQKLLTEIKKIEKKLGRVKTKSGYESRIIDIDIIFYDNLIYEGEELIIPHKYAHKRDFVLEPLNELVPDFTHPVLNLPISELLKRVKN